MVDPARALRRSWRRCFGGEYFVSGWFWGVSARERAELGSDGGAWGRLWLVPWLFPRDVLLVSDEGCLVAIPCTAGQDGIVVDEAVRAASCGAAGAGRVGCGDAVRGGLVPDLEAPLPTTESC